MRFLDAPERRAAGDRRLKDMDNNSCALECDSADSGERQVCRCQREREVSEGESEWGDTHVLVHVCVHCVE